MKFCSQCGKTLSILQHSGADLCQNCMPEDKTAHEVASASGVNGNALDNATLTSENGKLILKSKEGWLLWSGDAHDLHSLKAITDRAERILKIRERQKK